MTDQPAPEQYEVRPQQDVEMLYDFTQPKTKHLTTLNNIEPGNQDVPTSFYSPKQAGVVSEFQSLAGECLEFATATDIDLSNYQRFLVRRIGDISAVSKGLEGRLLKVLRTNYNVTEEMKMSSQIEKDKPQPPQQQQGPTYSYPTMK